MTRRFQPDKGDVALIVIDFQDGVLAAVGEPIRRNASKNVRLLLDLAGLMDIPVVVAEEYPAGLGRTVAEVVEKLGNRYQPIAKLAFSCCEVPSFVEKIRSLGVRHFVLVGAEAHVCVLQTALDLLAEGHEVSVVSDAVCSRRKSDWEVSLRMVEQAGGVVTSTEIIAFQLLECAGTAEFKHMSPLIRDALYE